MKRKVAKKVAIFDLDGTLFWVDTFPYFIIFFILRTPKKWLRIPELVILIFISKMFRLINNNSLKFKVLNILFNGQKKIRTDQIVSSFFNIFLLRTRYTRVVKALEEHISSGDFTILATASPSIYTNFLAKKMGFNHIESTNMALSEDGFWTGEVVGENCYGNIKRDRLNRLFSELQIDWKNCTFYSDHHADLPTFLMVGKGYAVRPTKKLGIYIGKKNIFLF